MITWFEMLHIYKEGAKEGSSWRMMLVVVVGGEKVRKNWTKCWSLNMKDYQADIISNEWSNTFATQNGSTTPRSLVSVLKQAQGKKKVTLTSDLTPTAKPSFLSCTQLCKRKSLVIASRKGHFRQGVPNLISYFFMSKVTTACLYLQWNFINGPRCLCLRFCMKMA